jgi:Na+-translocating ferredoxin:NAD+ oxidoreductase RnfE subunit
MRRDRHVDFAAMMVTALSEATQVTIALLGIFGVLFPAIVTGCIVFAVAQAMSERQQNLRRRQGG